MDACSDVTSNQSLRACFIIRLRLVCFTKGSKLIFYQKFQQLFLVGYVTSSASRTQPANQLSLLAIEPESLTANIYGKGFQAKQCSEGDVTGDVDSQCVWYKNSVRSSAYQAVPFHGTN